MCFGIGKKTVKKESPTAARVAGYAGFCLRQPVGRRQKRSKLADANKRGGRAAADSAAAVACGRATHPPTTPTPNHAKPRIVHRGAPVRVGGWRAAGTNAGPQLGRAAMGR